MAEYTDTVRLALSKAMHKAAQIVAIESKENFTPKGATLQLSQGIRALTPYYDADDNIVGMIISSARSRGGYNYALKQHNEALRHVSRFPLLSWYGEGQTGKTNQKRYAAGYYRLSGSSPKFATKYLEEGLKAKRDMVVQLLKNAVRQA